MVSQNIAPLEELWRETEKARQDPFLVQLVRGSGSPEEADRAAEQCDYPTYVCRQARLLAHMRTHYRDAWDTRIVHSQVAQAWPKQHEYPCEWEVEQYHGKILSAHVGTLIVYKSKHNAPVLWDYTLLDEDGTEVCRSWDLSRNWYLRDGLPCVNCHLNSGSQLLPRNGLTLSFGSLANQLSFKRTKDGSTVWWTRLARKEDDTWQPYISRRMVYGRRQQERHWIIMKPLSRAETQVFSTPHYPCVPEGSWGLFLEKSFLQDVHSEDRALLYSLTTGYIFSGQNFLEQLQNQYFKGPITAEKIIRVRTQGHYGLLDVAVNTVNKKDRSCYEADYEPCEESITAVISRIMQETPPTIYTVATVVNLCSLLKTDDYIYHKGKESSVNLLVSA